MPVHVGTAGWNYNHWAGPFYPQDLPQSEWLAFYADRFRSVEVNNTFYQVPEKSTLRRWYDTVPDDFLFAVKASRYITHMKKLKEPRESLARFLDTVRVLEDKLGPILFQLPPRWHFNADRLASFLDLLPDDLRYTFEFRDETWVNEETYRLLRDKEAAFCIYELAGYLSPREVTTDLAYVRLHGPGDKYQGDYSDQTLSEWAATFRDWAEQGRDVYCYFDNDQAGFAARNALRLQEMVTAG